MRILFTALLLVLVGAAQAQDSAFPSPFEFRSVDTVQLSKNEIYGKVRAWVATSYRSAKDVVQLDDKENGRIIGKAVMESPGYSLMGAVTGKVYTDYTFTIDIKDGRYRIALSDFVQNGGTSNSTSAGGSLSNEKPAGGYMYFNKKTWLACKRSCWQQAAALINSLRHDMRTDKSDKDTF